MREQRRLCANVGHVRGVNQCRTAHCIIREGSSSSLGREGRWSIPLLLPFVESIWPTPMQLIRARFLPTNVSVITLSRTSILPKLLLSRIRNACTAEICESSARRKRVSQVAYMYFLQDAPRGFPSTFLTHHGFPGCGRWILVSQCVCIECVDPCFVRGCDCCPQVVLSSSGQVSGSLLGQDIHDSFVVAFEEPRPAYLAS